MRRQLKFSGSPPATVAPGIGTSPVAASTTSIDDFSQLTTGPLAAARSDTAAKTMSCTKEAAIAVQPLPFP